jgi:hypothetical protein
VLGGAEKSSSAEALSLQEFPPLQPPQEPHTPNAVTLENSIRQSSASRLRWDAQAGRGFHKGNGFNVGMGRPR